MLKNNKFKIFMLVFILFIISFVFILINGNKYYLDVAINGVDNIDNINIEVEEPNIIEITDKKLKDGHLKLTIKSLNKGKTGIDIPYGEDVSYFDFFYVHSFGIITRGDFLGDINGDEIILLSMTILILVITIMLIKKFRQSYSISIYQYKNILYFGLIVFAIFSFIIQIFRINNYTGISGLIDTFISLTHLAILLFPIAIIVSILIIISNINLLRKEGFTWRNMLGIILSIIVIVLTIFPDILYSLLYNFDIHNTRSIYTYIEMFIEEFIYVVITYLECVLLGTIVLSLKAAKHIPTYDKDYIIILGCMIRKDGTLTPLLKSRVDRAIEFSKMQKDATSKDIIFVPSGGKGADEVISEAEAMKKYLLEKGIDEKHILIENKSKNTYENIKFSNKIIGENKKVAYSTTNYHVFRAGVIANSQNIYMEGIGAKTKTYFWINAFIREFIATLYSERKRHFLIILIIVLFLILIIGLKFISNLILKKIEFNSIFLLLNF